MEQKKKKIILVKPSCSKCVELNIVCVYLAPKKRGPNPKIGDEWTPITTSPPSLDVMNNLNLNATDSNFLLFSSQPDFSLHQPNLVNLMDINQIEDILLDNSDFVDVKTPPGQQEKNFSFSLFDNKNMDDLNYLKNDSFLDNSNSEFFKFNHGCDHPTFFGLKHFENSILDVTNNFQELSITDKKLDGYQYLANFHFEDSVSYENHPRYVNSTKSQQMQYTLFDAFFHSKTVNLFFCPPQTDKSVFILWLSALTDPKLIMDAFDYGSQISSKFWINAYNASSSVYLRHSAFEISQKFSAIALTEMKNLSEKDKLEEEAFEGYFELASYFLFINDSRTTRRLLLETFKCLNEKDFILIQPLHYSALWATV
ncbi:hypothetical protein HDU92_004031 [Lobulomyces angularis]|nr:hypothetical protein HDU92_004031 [Lobulomyces angularis]